MRGFAGVAPTDVCAWYNVVSRYLDTVVLDGAVSSYLNAVVLESMWGFELH